PLETTVDVEIALAADLASERHVGAKHGAGGIRGWRRGPNDRGARQRRVLRRVRESEKSPHAADAAAVLLTSHAPQFTSPLSSISRRFCLGASWMSSERARRGPPPRHSGSTT